jgi:hypothetical protein
VVFGGLVLSWVLQESKGEGDLFRAELGKSEGKVKEKVVEITRTLLMRRRFPAQP